MKKRKKQIAILLKSGILFLLIILLLSNCQNQELEFENTKNIEFQNTNSNPQVNLISLEQLKLETKDCKNFETLNTYLNKSNSTIHQRKKGTTDQITIDSENISKVSKDNVTTYTARVTNDNKVQNIIIQPKDSILEYSLLTYDFSNELGVENDGITLGTVSLTQLNENQIVSKNTANRFGNSDCRNVTVGIPYPCNGGPNHMPGQRCTATGQPGYIWVTTQVCFSSGGGSFPIKVPRDCTALQCNSPFDGINYGGGGGGSGSGSSNPGGGLGEINTSPLVNENGDSLFDIYLSASFNLLSNKLGGLTHQEKNWLSIHTKEMQKIIDFAHLNKWSNQTKVFADKTIQILSNSSLTKEQKFEQFKNAYGIYDPVLSNTAQKTDYEAKIKKYATSFKQWGNKEFGNYLESLLPLDSSFLDEDYKILYKTIREKAGELAWDYFRAIVGQTFESFKPVIEMALWEVGGGLALKVLSKLPVRYLTTPIKNVITRLRTPASSAFSNLKHSKKFGIQSYKQLGKQFKELGLKLSKEGVERHHLIEVRFFKNLKIRNKLKEKFGKTTDDWLCIIVEKTNKLTNSEHYKFTKAWRHAIGVKSPGTTGYHQGNVPFNVIVEQARKIYKDYPEILKALGI